MSTLGLKLGALNKIEPNTLQDVQAQQSTFQAIEVDADRLQRKALADAWCAAFVMPKLEGAPVLTTATLYRLQAGEALPELRQVVTETARQYRFLHPHVEFPDVFGDEEKGASIVY
ncbi:hypothetical protein ACFSC4_13010 [Deinococcus malanensis]|uniref:hypothetical protein n=1 Tax=Deinococcus malanensis TaxID=1706855 RepID=UPI003643F485